MTMDGRDKQYREVPDDDRVLLLMAPKEDLRTFSDYPNLVTCLESLTGIYEESRSSRGLLNDYTIQDLWDWIDSFARLELFIYDREIGRYRMTRRTELRELFIQQIQKLGEVSPAGDTERNSKSNPNRENGRLSNSRETEEDEEEEDWD